MNNLQRGVYQPLGDIPIYDMNDEEVEDERSRLPLLIVIALIVLAAFAGVVWLAYNQGVARGRAGGPVIITAPAGPVRTAGDGGEPSTPFTGLKVYTDPVPPDQEAQTSTLAAPPPDTSPYAITPPAPPPAEAPPVRLNPVAPPPAAAPAPSPPVLADAVPTPAPPKAVPAPPKPVPAPAPVAAAPAVQAGGSATSGKAVLQIGAYPSEDLAANAWATFQKKYGATAPNLVRDIQKADLGAKGTWYRLRAGPFVDKAAASTACDALKAQGATCFVTAP